MSYTLFNEDFLDGVDHIEENSVDLVIADPPYGLGKDFGNDSDMMHAQAFLKWTQAWIEAVVPKLKTTGSLYIFTTWRFSPEIFSFIKTRMMMVNEIVVLLKTNLKTA